MDAVTAVPTPINEPVLTYAPGSPERAQLETALRELADNPIDLVSTIGGEKRLGGGAEIDVVQPHAHSRVLGTLKDSTVSDAQDAVAAAKAAAPGWREMSFDDRAAIMLKAADLLSGPWRMRMNAATMLGQSKTCVQAEIDSACELADFWRFNVAFAQEILADQPSNGPGVWNRMDYRPLEGFVYAVTPFNFSAIAGNLPTAPAIMGNTVVWKASTSQTRAAVMTMELLEAAGMPPGVINLVVGRGRDLTDVAVGDPGLAGVHFTGSTAVFQQIWANVGANISRYASYPRLVGETGGKDFIVAHPSADPQVLTIAMVRGAFEYQGQKCSAASRAFVPRSIWSKIKDDLADLTNALPMGDVTDFSNFMGAVIDQRAFDKLSGVLASAADDDAVSVVAGGEYDGEQGWFIRPTVLEVSDPEHEHLKTEYFGPILSVYVYEDSDYDAMLTQMESASPYGLTGSIIAQDRAAVIEAQKRLRFAAGNFYVNDKPTGAVVGQQPFGGGRASGTNDKAGSKWNLMRWTSPRAIKETFVPPLDHRYPHMG